jgi:hypothetical protein
MAMEAHLAEGRALKQFGPEGWQSFPLDLLPNVPSGPGRQHGHPRQENSVRYGTLDHRRGTVHKGCGAERLVEIHAGWLCRHYNQIRPADRVSEGVVGCALQINEDEGGPIYGIPHLLKDVLLGHAAYYPNAGAFLESSPSLQMAIWVGVEEGYGVAC